MPYARISGTRDGAGAIDYALGGGAGHNGNDIRNQYIMGINLFPPESESYKNQMARYWRQASAKNKVQVRRIVISFSREELDPDDPKSILTAARICNDLTAENYPGRQALICIQTDGKGGLVHGHILVNNVSMMEGIVPDAMVRDHKNNKGKWMYRTEDVNVPAGRGCIDAQTNHNFVAERAKAVAERYIDLDAGKANSEYVSQTERAKREAEKYVLKDDLRERITAAQAESISLDDFKLKLKVHGVEIKREGTSKKHGTYFTYTLIDDSNIPEGEKITSKDARSYKLGDGFGPDYFRMPREDRQEVMQMRWRPDKASESSDAQELPATSRPEAADNPPDVPRHHSPSASKKPEADAAAEKEKQAKAAALKRAMELRRKAQIKAMERDIFDLGEKLMRGKLDEDGEEISEALSNVRRRKPKS